MDNFVGHLMAFKKGSDDAHFDEDVFVEVVEFLKDGHIELAFGLPKGARGYLRFRLQYMMIDLATQSGGEE